MTDNRDIQHYERPAHAGGPSRFTSDQTVTSHKIHKMGEGYHDLHYETWDKIQIKILHYKQMLDAYGKLTEAYLDNNNFSDEIASNGLHQFFQLFPTINYNDIQITNFNSDNVYFRNKNHHEPKDGPNLKSCTTSYYSFRNPALSRRSTTPTSTYTTPAELNSSCDNNFSQGSNVTQFLSLKDYYNTTNFNNVNIHDDDGIYNLSGKGIPLAATRDVCGNNVKPNELYYAASGIKADSQNANAKNYGWIDIYNQKQLDTTSLNDLNGIAEIEKLTGLDKSPKYVKYADEIGGSGSSTDTVTTASNLDEIDYKYLKDSRGNVYYERVVGLVLRHSKITGITGKDTINGNTEYIQIYDTEGIGGSSPGKKSYNIDNATNSDFVSDAFAKVSGGEASVRLYSIRRHVSGSESITNNCHSISSKTLLSPNLAIDDNKKLGSAGSLLDIQPYHKPINPNGQPIDKKWCDIRAGQAEAGKYLLKILQIAKVHATFIMQEQYLFDLFQRGTVVQLIQSLPGTAITVGIDMIRPITFPFPNGNPIYNTPDTPPDDFDGNNRLYIVFPHKQASTLGVNVTRFSNMAGITNIGTNVEYFQSQFAIVPWTINTLEDLKDYSSGKRFRGMTEKAYQEASKSLRDSYNLIEHDIKELNKIAALQDDVTVLGNMHYYRMIIYIVILFFLIVSVYYISK